jgi:hypothetical protein
MLERITWIKMLDYARQHVRDALKVPRTAVLATSGPAGVQVGEYPCEAIDLDLYMLVPRTSDHLYNLENNVAVTVLAAGWELRGEAQLLSPGAPDLDLRVLHGPEAEWCALVRVHPCQVQIRRDEGWGNLETIDLKPLPDRVTRPQNG